MRPIRNPSFTEIWAQPANPLDEYHATLVAQRACSLHSDYDKCEARLPPAYKLPGDVLGKPLSQFEIIAELSLELISVALQSAVHIPNLIVTKPSSFVSYSLRVVAKDTRVFASSQGLITSSPLIKSSFFNKTVSGGVDIPGVIKEVYCGVDQQTRLARASITFPQHTIQNIQPKILNQTDHCELVRTTIGQSASSAMSADAAPSPSCMSRSRRG